MSTNLVIKTACPLDCYDACDVMIKNDKICGDLCTHLKHYDKHKRIQTPLYKGQEITIQDALTKLAMMLEESSPSDILHYRGSGNFALMQEVTDHFFANLGATLTNGTLCDGAGEAGIIEGRGSNKNMPLSEIAKSDSRVRCLQRIARRGLSSACIEGMMASSAPVISIMDADLQHDETILPQMLAKIEDEGAEIVVATLPDVHQHDLCHQERELLVV